EIAAVVLRAGILRVLLGERREIRTFLDDLLAKPLEQLARGLPRLRVALLDAAEDVPRVDFVRLLELAFLARLVALLDGGGVDLDPVRETLRRVGDVFDRDPLRVRVARLVRL